MSKINIINPKAGKGLAEKFVNNGEKIVYTTCVGDAERIAYEICNENEYADITVYGGDGTINEAVNGIMKSKYADSATLSAYPAGTGNDFLRVEKEKTVVCDLGKYNDKYFINMLNIGFDCDVVIKTQKMKKKPFVSGSMAYILSVFGRFFEKFGQKMSISVKDENGNIHSFDDEYLLCLVANGTHYGGGFNSSPESLVTDGILELLLVEKISRLKFISLIGKYKKGTHIKDGKIIDQFADVVKYIKCKSVTIKGVEYYCADGEIEYLNDKNTPLNINVIPNSLRFKF